MTKVTRMEVRRNQMTKVIEIKDSKIPDVEETNETDAIVQVEEKLIFDCLQKDNLQEQVPCNRCHTSNIKTSDKILQSKAYENMQLAGQEKISGCLMLEGILVSLRHGSFPMNFAKLLRILLLMEHFQWLLLLLTCKIYLKVRGNINLSR